MIVDEKNEKIVIQECKNSTEDKLPKESDIKDGLFKILLFNQIEDLEVDGKKYGHSVSLRLSGKISSVLSLPATQESIRRFIDLEKLSEPEQRLVRMLNEESELNHYSIVIDSN